MKINDFLQGREARILGFLGGLLLAFLILWLGWLLALFVVVFAMAGFLIGFCLDKNYSFRDIIHILFIKGEDTYGRK